MGEKGWVKVWVRGEGAAAMRQDVRSDSLKAFFNKHPLRPGIGASSLRLGKTKGMVRRMPQLAFDTPNFVGRLSFVWQFEYLIGFSAKTREKRDRDREEGREIENLS